MAIKPSDAIKLSLEDNDAINGVEKRIDEYLKNHYSGKSISLWNVGYEELNQRSKAELIRRYVEQGWNVIPMSSQIDGNWLDFREKDTPSTIVSDYWRDR